jgi:hypothetical protein
LETVERHSFNLRAIRFCSIPLFVSTLIRSIISGVTLGILNLTLSSSRQFGLAILSLHSLIIESGYFRASFSDDALRLLDVVASFVSSPHAMNRHDAAANALRDLWCTNSLLGQLKDYLGFLCGEPAFLLQVGELSRWRVRPDFQHSVRALVQIESCQFSLDNLVEQRLDGAGVAYFAHFH